MSLDLERLRRGLYRPGASAADLEAYRRGLARSEAPAAVGDEQPRRPERPPSARRRPVIALVAGSVVVGAALLLWTTGPLSTAEPGPGTRTSAPPVRVPPPVRVVATTAGLGGDPVVRRAVDRLTAAEQGRADDAADDLDTAVRSAVLSAASSRTILMSAAGRADDGRTSLDLPRPVEVAAGDVLLLSTAMREPASATWEVRGRRQGEVRGPHPIVAVSSRAGRADGLQVAVLRVPVALTVTAVAIRTSPATALRYRVERHAAWVCTASESPYCVPPPAPG